MFHSKAAPLLIFAAVTVPFFLLVTLWEVGFLGWFFGWLLGLLWRLAQWNPIFAACAFLWLFFMLHPAMWPAHVAWHRTLFPEPVKRKGMGRR